MQVSQMELEIKECPADVIYELFPKFQWWKVVLVLEGELNNISIISE